MTSLFISYSRKDIAAARKLTEAFKGQDLDFWIDWEGIAPTVDWWKEIEKGIEEADIFLFLLSPDSCASKVCKREIEHAAKNGKRLIPLVVRDVKSDESPTELGHLNWIFLREQDEFHPAFSKLIMAIQTDYAWVQTHRQLQVKALEWERSNHEMSFLLRGKELHEAEEQLVANATKEPHPTDLQREYVLGSRQASDRQRRVTMGVAISGVIALAVLAVFGFVQARLATANAVKEQAASTLAFSNANTAEAASTLAFDNAETAQANAEDAERQSKIALARQLAAQAQTINATRNSKQLIAVLLAVQSMKLYPTREGTQVLLNDDFAAPTIAQVTHNDVVNSVAFSSDGRYVVSGSEDFTARVVEAVTGKEVARMTHDWGVTSVAFSPDGKYVVSGSWDGMARVWDASSGKEIARMTHDQWVATVAFSPDGKYAASGGGDHIARVWESSTGNQIASLSHDENVLTVAFSPDGNSVASGGGDHTVRVWKTHSGTEVVRMVHDDIVLAVAFSPDGKYVASQSVDDTAHVWEISTGNEVARMIHKASPSRGGGGGAQQGKQSVGISPDGKFVVSGSDVTACVWEISSSKEISCVTHDTGVTSVGFSPDGRYVISGGADGTARVWEAATGKEMARMTHDGPVHWVAFSPDGKHVVSGGDNTARVWEVNTGDEIYRGTAEDVIYSVSPEGKYVATSSDAETIRILEASSGREVAHVIHANLEVDGSVTFSPNGKYLVTSGGNDMIRVWETLTGREVSTMRHEGVSGRVGFTSNGTYVVSTSCERTEETEDGILCRESTIRVWEALTGREALRLENAMYGFDFSPDGNYVVSASSDGMARVWEVSSGREIAHMPHEADVRAANFSPDGKYVVSTACETAEAMERGVVCPRSSLRVWETLTGKEIAYMSQAAVVTEVSFSPDGKYVVSGACEEPDHNVFCILTTVRVWAVFTGTEVLQIDQVVGSVNFSASGKYIIYPPLSISPENNTVRIWEASSGKEIAHILHDNMVEAVAFSPDETYVVTGSWDRTARVWEVNGGREVAHMTHDAFVNSVAFSPDGRFVASGGDNEAIRVWEATSGREVARITLDDLVDALAFSPDGKTILWENPLNGSPHSRLWQPADLIADACARLPRNLTQAEWDQYIGSVLPYQAICDQLPLEPEATPIP